MTLLAVLNVLLHYRDAGPWVRTADGVGSRPALHYSERALYVSPTLVEDIEAARPEIAISRGAPGGDRSDKINSEGGPRKVHVAEWPATESTELVRGAAMLVRSAARECKEDYSGRLDVGWGPRDRGAGGQRRGPSVTASDTPIHVARGGVWRRARRQPRPRAPTWLWATSRCTGPDLAHSRRRRARRAVPGHQQARPASGESSGNRRTTSMRKSRVGGWAAEIFGQIDRLGVERPMVMQGFRDLAAIVRRFREGAIRAGATRQDLAAIDAEFVDLIDDLGALTARARLRFPELRDAGADGPGSSDGAGGRDHPGDTDAINGSDDTGDPLP